MDLRTIMPKNWQKFNPAIKVKCDKIAGVIATEFGEISIECHKGSWSFVYKTNTFSKTIAKLIPQYEDGEAIILVGFSDAADNAEAYARKINSFVELVKIAPTGEPFFVSKMKETQDMDFVASTIIDFVKSNME